MSLARLTILAVVIAAVTHIGVVVAAPYVLMNTAMTRITTDVGTNVWRHAPRVSEKSRRIVRPSPDLAYSSCVYDLSAGPIRVTAAAWSDYMSVSAFAANSDNFFVINDRQAPAGVDIVLIAEGDPKPAGAAMVVASPTTRGIILQRRIAPTAERFAEAEAARKGDICSPLK